MNRRSALLSLGGLIVAGPQALEALERLMWKRRFFPGMGDLRALTATEMQSALRKVYEQFEANLFPIINPLLVDFPRQPRSLFTPPPSPMRWGSKMIDVSTLTYPD